MDELIARSALGIAELVKAGSVSCAEVVETHLARIEQVNPALNAIVRVLADSARTEAQALDALIAAGDDPGPLAGVPLSVKENIDMAGLPTTHGAQAFADAVVPVDAPVVERMRAAGAIPIARTNLPEMALRVHTDNELHGLTRNPWNLARTVAGSSGGEGAALATGMSALGLGNDIGGSLRNPANACGIASIRPTEGRIPDVTLVPGEDALLAQQIMSVQGPMARTVADVRAGLVALAGAHPRDPWSVTVPFEVAGNQPIKVAMVAEPPGGRTDPVVAAAVRQAGELLAAAGYEVTEVTPPRYEEAIEAWATFLLGDLGVQLDQLRALMGGDARTFLDYAYATRPPIDAAGLSAVLVTRHGIARAWSQFFAEYPLVLTPTWTELPFEHGFDIASAENAVRTLEIMRPVVAANLMGLPSACVPVTRDEPTGLPIGVLLTGARFTDALCLDAAEAVEAGSTVHTPIDPALR